MLPEGKFSDFFSRQGAFLVLVKGVRYSCDPFNDLQPGVLTFLMEKSSLQIVYDILLQGISFPNIKPSKEFAMK